MWERQRTPTLSSPYAAIPARFKGWYWIRRLRATTTNTTFTFRHVTPKKPRQAYPVLYLIPGRSSSYQAWFNAGAAQVADEMIHAGGIPPFIIVSTSDTDSDLNADLIHNDLIPYIEAHYRIRPERRFHAVAGGSLGGVAAYRIVFSDPARFASAGIFGNGATAGEEDRIRGWLKAMEYSEKPRVFLNTGLSDTYMLERAKAMISILDEFNVSHSEIFTEGDHTYIYWVSNFKDYLYWLAEDWR